MQGEEEDDSSSWDPVPTQLQVAAVNNYSSGRGRGRRGSGRDRGLDRG
jgi:hypothetical protein